MSTQTVGNDELRVLVVDDHDDMLSMMHLVMKRRSYTVETARSGHQALQIAEQFAPHVVVSDIGMPGMNGCEMMSALRSMNQIMPFRSIALTGYDSTNHQDAVQAAGYDAQLTKPVDFEVLFGMIDDLASSVKTISMQQSQVLDNSASAVQTSFL